MNCTECGKELSAEWLAEIPGIDLCSGCGLGDLQDKEHMLKYRFIKEYEAVRGICKIVFGINEDLLSYKEWQAMDNVWMLHWSYEEWAEDVAKDGEIPTKEWYGKDTAKYYELEKIAATAMKKILDKSPYYSNNVEYICDKFGLDYDDFCLAIMRSTLLKHYYG